MEKEKDRLKRKGKEECMIPPYPPNQAVNTCHVTHLPNQHTRCTAPPLQIYGLLVNLNLGGEERKSEKGDEALGAPSAGGELGCWHDTGAAGRIGCRWVAQRLSDGLGSIDSSLLLMHRFPFEGS